MAPERKLTNADIDLIEAEWLRGNSQRAIGRMIGVCHRTVAVHLRQEIIPRWEALTHSGLASDLARVAQIEARAWEAFDRSSKPSQEMMEELAFIDGSPEMRVTRKVKKRKRRTGEKHWLDVICWCIQFRANVFGYQRQAEIGRDSEMRVAGMGPDAANLKALQRMRRKIGEIKGLEAAMQAEAN